ncbi:MAG: hypothetical protein GTO53_10595 [Planctomycetales bacterium]|nr:hypothetical protein [Planctomycetales bacterium]NIM09570.1 hypothetical protein [Planctomycetales bacterium]NIN09060.1 hypothetical protein [Planctomycetales bacterium]NIN78172.1 hypothetical protein [Planctomycetales bacterium]NIO35356.1 hypothetical protein [Planctomycetales bacterium]
MTNTILEELYNIRREILAEHGDDLAEYLRAGLAKTKAAGHPVAKITQRTIRCTGAAKSGVLAVDNQSSPPGDR